MLSYTARGFRTDPHVAAVAAGDAGGQLGEPAERHDPAQEPRRRDPRHAVALRARRGDVPGPRPRARRRLRQLVRRRRELAAVDAARLDVPAQRRPVAAGAEAQGRGAEVRLVATSPTRSRRTAAATRTRPPRAAPASSRSASSSCPTSTASSRSAATDGIFETGTRTPPDRGGRGADQRPGVAGAARRRRRPLRRRRRRGPDRRAGAARADRVPRQPLPGPARRAAASRSSRSRAGPTTCSRRSSRRASSSRSRRDRPALAGLARVRRRRPPARAEQGVDVAAGSTRRRTRSSSANLDRAREGSSTVDERADDVRRQHRQARRRGRPARARARAASRFALPGGSLAAGLGHGRPRRRRDRPGRRIAGRHAAGAAAGRRRRRTWPGPLHRADAAARRRALETVGLGEVRIRYTLAPPVVDDGGRARLGRRARRHRAAGDARRRAARPAGVRRRRPASCGSACSATTGACPPATACASTSPRPTSRRSGARTSPATVGFTRAELVLPAR